MYIRECCVPFIEVVEGPCCPDAARFNPWQRRRKFCSFFTLHCFCDLSSQLIFTPPSLETTPLILLNVLHRHPSDPNAVDLRASFMVTHTSH